jgi:hypothetical protein
LTKHTDNCGDEQAFARLFLRAGPDTAPPPGAKDRVLQRVLAGIEQGSGAVPEQAHGAWRPSARVLRRRDKIT